MKNTIIVRLAGILSVGSLVGGMAGAATLTLETRSGFVEGTCVPVKGRQAGVSKPMWYEVRASAKNGQIIDYGAFPCGPEWFFIARHLAVGTNEVTVFAVDGAGKRMDATVSLVVPDGETPKIRPRPVPAEVWWGGLGENQQLLDPKRPWSFVKKYADGYFLHGAYWNVERVKAIGAGLSAQLKPYAPKYCAELGGQQFSLYDTASTARHTGINLAAIRRYTEIAGMPLSEITHDYGIGFEPVAEHYLTKINPKGREPEIIDYAVNQLWRDGYFLKCYAEYPSLKGAQTTSPAWRWFEDYPSCWSDETRFSVTRTDLTGKISTDGIYTPVMKGSRKFDRGKKPLLVEGHEVDLRFNLKAVLDSFIRMSEGTPGHSTFSFYSDYPYAHMVLGGKDSPRGIRARKMLRAIEGFLHGRGAFHTFVCNDNAPTEIRDAMAAHRAWGQASLKSMQLHQLEGGRADRYLFESWFYTALIEGKKRQELCFPFWVAPEDQPWSYTYLVREAVKYIKGIKDEEGTLEPLELSVKQEGRAIELTLVNRGDVACLPALVAIRGQGRVDIQFRDGLDQDVTEALQSAEGWSPGALLEPGARVVLKGVARTGDGGVTVEAFWNPQDPAGVVRDRVKIDISKER